MASENLQCLTDDEHNQRLISNSWAGKGFLQSVIDPNDTKGLKCDYIDRWSRFYIQKYTTIETSAKNKNILEIGCGCGRNLFSISHFVNFAYGIDIAEKQIEHALERQIQNKLNNIKFYTNSIELHKDSPRIDIAFTMWVLAGFSTAANLVNMLVDYKNKFPDIKNYIFFEQVASSSYAVIDDGSFRKIIRTQQEYNNIFQDAGLRVVACNIICEKGFGPLYRLIYHWLYKKWPYWLNINWLIFPIDRFLVKRYIRPTFTDVVFICEKE